MIRPKSPRWSQEQLDAIRRKPFPPPEQIKRMPDGTEVYVPAPKPRKSRPGASGWHKYGAVATVVDGIRFASKKEARVYGDLKLREKAGEITDLKLQPVVHCNAGGVHICDYRGDFMYFDRKLSRFIWLDAKGVRTPVYKLKVKIVRALAGIEITEI